MPFVDNKGLSIFYEDAGTGPAVVLGHSFLCSGTMWQEQLRPLSARFRVLNLDLRGHGRSDAARARFTLDDAVTDVVAVLDHLRVERAVWCGLSFGGMVAMRAALDFSERVDSLILLDTNAGAESAARKALYTAMGVATRLLGVGAMSGPLTDLMFGATTLEQKPELVHAWQRDLRAVNTASALRVLDALLNRRSVLQRLPEIEVPALVIVGAEDRATPPALAKLIHAGLADSRYVEIPAAGHLSALEQPVRVTRAILDFLEWRCRSALVAR